MKKNLIFFGFLILALIHLLVLKTITFTAWPEMFSYPYLINKDFLIYHDFAHPYAPLLTFMLAFYYKLFGMGLFTHQIFVWSLILINDLLIFITSRKILKRYFSLAPVTIYVFLQPIFEGNMLWFDLATVPFIVSSYLVCLYIKQIPRRLFWIGFLLALALLTKQQAVILAALIFLTLLFSKETRGKIHYFILGGFIPVFFMFLILLSAWIFDDYIFWTLIFPLYWLPKFPGYVDMPSTKNIILVLMSFGLPFLYVAKNPFKMDFFQRIILVSVIATVLMAFPRFSYFHLQPAIAAMVILLAIILKQQKKIAAFFLAGSLLSGVWLWKDYRPFIGVNQARFYDKADLEFAEFVKQNTTPDDRVYFLGPHSLSYVLADRVPSIPWIDNYVWHFEIPGMQQKQIAGLEREENIVIFKQPYQKGLWYQLGVYKPKQIEEYINNKFQKVNAYKNGVEVWKKKD